MAVCTLLRMSIATCKKPESPGRLPLQDPTSGFVLGSAELQGELQLFVHLVCGCIAGPDTPISLGGRLWEGR